MQLTQIFVGLLYLFCDLILPFHAADIGQHNTVGSNYNDVFKHFHLFTIQRNKVIVPSKDSYPHFIKTNTMIM